MAISTDESSDKLRETELINEQLQEEIKRSSEEVIVKSNELAASKADLLKHRNEINVS